MIIDGKRISGQIKDEVRAETEKLAAQGIRLTLAVVQVGEDPASTVYVRNKQRACEYTGIASVKIAMSEETTQEELLAKVRELNEDPAINGILVQLPLPKGLNADEVIRAISPLKDVDGFHPQSVGALSIGLPGFKSCTPAGIIELIKRSGIETTGKECVIVGRSNIVGKPMAMMMIRENATVTVAHSKTVDLPAVCRRADILIAQSRDPDDDRRAHGRRFFLLSIQAVQYKTGAFAKIHGTGPGGLLRGCGESDRQGADSKAKRDRSER